MTRSKFAYYDDKNIIPPSTNWFHCHLPSRLLFMRSTAMTWRGRKIATRGVLCLAKQWNPWPVLSQGGVHKLRRQVLGLFLTTYPQILLTPYIDIFYLKNFDENFDIWQQPTHLFLSTYFSNAPRPTTATSIGLQLYIRVQWVKNAEFLHFGPCEPIFKKILPQTWSNSLERESICLQNKCFHSKEDGFINHNNNIDQFSNLIWKSCEIIINLLSFSSKHNRCIASKIAWSKITKWLW